MSAKHMNDPFFEIRKIQAKAFIFHVYASLLRLIWPCLLFIPPSLWLMGRAIANGARPTAIFGGPLEPIPMMPGLVAAFACGAAFVVSSRALAGWLTSMEAPLVESLRGVELPPMVIKVKANRRRANRRKLPVAQIAQGAADALAGAISVAIVGGIASIVAAVVLRLYVWHQHSSIGAFGGPSVFPIDIIPAVIWSSEWLGVIVLGLFLYSKLFRWIAGLERS